MGSAARIPGTAGTFTAELGFLAAYKKVYMLAARTHRVTTVIGTIPISAALRYIDQETILLEAARAKN